MISSYVSMAALAAVPASATGVILTMVFLAIIVGTLLFFLSRIRRCPSNRVLVIYGKTGSGAARCVHGGAAFVWPLIQAYEYLDLEPFVVPIDLANALSQENIRVSVPTTVTAAISNQEGIMQNAAVRLLGLSRGAIQAQAQDIILGQMRAVIATMRIEEINSDRQAFLAKVNEAVSVELEKIGLYLINVNIRDIEDESGYIIALGRKAAAEAINQANIDVAEQEKAGQTGVAERQRDTRVSVAKATAAAEIGEAEALREKRQKIAAANASAEIGEADAAREKRQKTAVLDAKAVESETEADANKATYRANQRVAEEDARNRSESAARQADGAIRVAQEMAQKAAEEARAEREKARLQAEVVVPANAEKEQLVIQAEARKLQDIRTAEGQAQAMLAKMSAEAEGVQKILDGKAEGYKHLVDSCQNAQQAAALLLIEKLIDVAAVQTQAIQNLPIEKITVWDSGSGEGLRGLGSRLMATLPPIHDLARQVGLELPEMLGKVTTKSETQADEKAGGEDTQQS